ncbi:hypothetical protein NC652_041113 [Populus alba x Populus x berolinensis]|nr:hypothetical protein NC652_041113 [Populus alba x Populus x berolinensis]
MKRMLAFIGEIEYVIIGIIIGDLNYRYARMIIYIIFYICMNLGTFACIVLFALCLLSLEKLPPLTSFFKKLYLFWCGMQACLYILVSIEIFMNIFFIYYYLKIMKLLIIRQN